MNNIELVRGHVRFKNNDIELVRGHIRYIHNDLININNISNK